MLVNTLIKSNKANLTAKSSTLAYDFIEHIADVIVQTETVEADRNSATSYTNRDLFMAENAVWLKKHSDYSMSVWAHNEHIKNAESDNNKERAMGYYINNKLQGGYLTVGFSFAKGSVTAVDTEKNGLGNYSFLDNTVSGFSNELLSKAKATNFFYKPSIVYRNANLPEYFTKTPFYQIGAIFYSAEAQAKITFSPLSEANFNYMIHINQTHNSDIYRLK